MQTKEHRQAAESILNKLGGATVSPALWDLKRTPSSSFDPSPQPWVERAISSALLLMGDEAVVHAHALRVAEGTFRIVIVTDSLLIVSDTISTEAPVLAAPMVAVPRNALRSLSVVAEQGVIVRGSVITSPQGYVDRDARSWPGVIAVTAEYASFGEVTFVGQGEETDHSSIRGLLDSLREDLIASR